ncbi:ATP-binding protein [Streptomyces sp. NPDC051976]|uniref:ATP-binding protein n=1 Tax=Streptomyces sp. NPDC051976 TaxID=3154947 RepID=UPI0034430608
MNEISPVGCLFPRRPRSAGRARAFVREFLAAVPDGDRFAEVGELLVSELVANAIEHARTPAGRLIEVTCAVRDGRLRIEVHDASTDRPLRRDATPSDTGGRGLLLVEALSAAWGCCPRAGGVGKYVWVLIDPQGAVGSQPHVPVSTSSR